MGKFEQRFVFVPDHEYTCKADEVVDVLSGTVLALREQYENIFGGLDDVLRAINEVAKQDIK